MKCPKCGCEMTKIQASDGFWYWECWEPQCCHEEKVGGEKSVH